MDLDLLPDYLRTDECEDLVASLKLVVLSTQQLQCDLQYWKWTLIGAHSSLQAAVVIHLSFGNDFLVARPRDVKKWLSAYSDDTDYPDMHMDYFMELYNKAKSEKVHGFQLATSDAQDDSVRRLLGLRNNFVHFMPKGWSVQLAGLPTICLDALNIISALARGPIQMRWEDDDQRARFERLLSESFDRLNALSREYARTRLGSG